MDTAYVSHKKNRRGYLFAESWIRDLASKRGYIVTKREDENKLYVERPNGTFYDVYNVANDRNYNPTDREVKIRGLTGN